MEVNSINIKSNIKKSTEHDTQKTSKIENNIYLKPNSKSRKDSRGVPIIKGNKTHKISYADRLFGTNLVVIINVDSYKEFNVVEIESGETEDSNKNNKKDDVSCKCNIL